MKKVLTFLTIVLIILATTIPAFAVECEQHDIVYPSEPAYTHEMGIDIYECTNCGHEMWHCEECDMYMPIEELKCAECDEYRIAFSSAEQMQINEMKKDDKIDKFTLAALIILGTVFISVIIYLHRHDTWVL